MESFWLGVAVLLRVLIFPIGLGWLVAMGMGYDRFGINILNLLNINNIEIILIKLIYINILLSRI